MKNLKQLVAGWLASAVHALDPTKKIYSIETVTTLAREKAEEASAYSAAKDQLLREASQQELRAKRAEYHLSTLAQLTRKRIADMRRFAAANNYTGAGSKIEKIAGDIESDCTAYLNAARPQELPAPPQVAIP